LSAQNPQTFLLVLRYLPVGLPPGLPLGFLPLGCAIILQNLLEG